MTREISFAEPIGMLLVLAVLAALAIGVLVESALPGSARTWLGGASHEQPHRGAAAGVPWQAVAAAAVEAPGRLPSSSISFQQ